MNSNKELDNLKRQIGYLKRNQYITENVIKVLQLEKSPAAQKVCDTIEQLYQCNNISVIKRGSHWYFENCDPPHYVSVFLTVELLEKFHLKYLYW